MEAENSSKSESRSSQSKSLSLRSAFFSLTLLGCSKRADINELTHHFFEHQSAFNKLTDIACALNSSLNTQFHNYKIDTAMEYPEHLATQFIKVNSLLRRINAEGIAISPPSDDKLECSDNLVCLYLC